MRPWMILLPFAVALGAALGHAAPASWDLGPADGLLFGSALYAGSWRRFVERREGRAEIGALSDPALLLGLSLRAALFTLLVCVQAYLCFQAVPSADVRRGFVVLSAWVVMQALIDTGTARAAATASAASQPPAR
jgi:hypothetical protein